MTGSPNNRYSLLSHSTVLIPVIRTDVQSSEVRVYSKPCPDETWQITILFLASQRTTSSEVDSDVGSIASREM